MAINLPVIIELIKKLFNKQNNDNRNQGNSTSNSNIAVGGSITSINIVNNNHMMVVINDPAKIKNLWSTINLDSPVEIDYIDNLWLHSGKKIINIGRYYSCKANEEEKLIWIGAEADVTGTISVYLFTHINQFNMEGKEPRRLCGIAPDNNGAYIIPIDGFLSGNNPEELTTALETKLVYFLEDIFK